MQNALVYVNGYRVPADEAKVSIFDRSFLYGDSLYEVVRTYEGRILALREHLDRLEESARLARFQLTFSRETLEKDVRRCIHEFREQHGHTATDLYVRIIVSRGSGDIGFSEKNLRTPNTVVLIALPIDPFLPKNFEAGTRLQIVDRRRNAPDALTPAMKSGNYLNSLLAYLEAESKGFPDAIMLDQEGFVTEGTTYNVFYVKRGIVVTSPFDVGILDGITRRIVLEACEDLGIETRITRFTRQHLYQADEIFAVSTIKEVLPVLALDTKGFKAKKPGAVTRALKEQFAVTARRYLEPA